jgi:hypothetical protein
MAPQRLEHARGDVRIRTIVEGECDRGHSQGFELCRQVEQQPARLRPDGGGTLGEHGFGIRAVPGCSGIRPPRQRALVALIGITVRRAALLDYWEWIENIIS